MRKTELEEIWAPDQGVQNRGRLPSLWPEQLRGRAFAEIWKMGGWSCHKVCVGCVRLELL